MKARFVGDPADHFSGPDAITVWGVQFVKDKWREVDNNRFATHSHFQTDADEDGAPGPSVDELKYRLDEAGVKYHHASGHAKLAALWADHEKGAGA